MKSFLTVLCAALAVWGLTYPSRAAAAVYYISPTGNDSNSGASPAAPWATFEHAWTKLFPGDTLLLMDGVYRQTLQPNVRNGEPGKPITIRALHDGKAIIDGENMRETVLLGDGENPEVGHYFIVEGIVAKNSTGDVFSITGSHNTLRRISGYNANTDENKMVIEIAYPSAQYNLVEDCVAAGTGRKMISIWHAAHNTVRRCFADWRAWDGRAACQAWPWGENIDIYGADDNIVENSIGYGSVPYYSITVRTNEAEHGASNNKVLGSLAVYAGMEKTGAPIAWPASRPGPTSCTELRDWTERSQRVGFAAYSSGGKFDGNLWRDIFAWGNAGHGFAAVGSVDPTNAAIDHSTIYNNGLDNGYNGGDRDGPVGTEVIFKSQLEAIGITNSFIEGTDYNGAGARLAHRYVDGVLMDGTDGRPLQFLWPWPMEARIKSELGISVTNDIYYKIVKQQAPPDLPTLCFPTALARRPCRR